MQVLHISPEHFSAFSVIPIEINTFIPCLDAAALSHLIGLNGARGIPLLDIDGTSSYQPFMNHPADMPYMSMMRISL